MGHSDRPSTATPSADDVNAIRPVIPQGEALRRAVRWLSEQDEWSLKGVEEAARRFDLSPAEEEFLIRQFIKHRGIGN